jgi:hypothetical protein
MPLTALQYINVCNKLNTQKQPGRIIPDTFLDVYFNRNVQKSTISTSDVDFSGKSQEGYAIWLVLFGGLKWS